MKLFNSLRYIFSSLLMWPAKKFKDLPNVKAEYPKFSITIQLFLF